MRSTIALNGSFFNTQRMLEQYVINAYFPERRVEKTSETAQPDLENTLSRIRVARHSRGSMEAPATCRR